MPKLKDERLIPEVWILNHLAQVGQASPAETHRAYRVFLRDANALRRKQDRLKGSSYPSFIRYFWSLEQEGKIKRVGTKELSDVAPPQLRHFTDQGSSDARQVIYQIG